MSTQILVDIGLTEKEAQLYMLLLEEGEQPIQELVRKSKLKRPTVYATLKTLKEKELVSLRDKAKKLHAHPLAPNKLLDVAKKGMEQAQQAHGSLVSLLPHLISNYTLNTEKPVVSIYEGIEGLKKAYMDILNEGEEIYAVFQNYSLNKELEKWLIHTYVQKRIQKKVFAKVLVSGSQAKEFIERSEKEYREVRYLKDKLFLFEHEIDVAGDKVAFIDYKKHGDLIGIVIHHPSMARTMKALFLVAWHSTEV